MALHHDFQRAKSQSKNPKISKSSNSPDNTPQGKLQEGLKSINLTTSFKDKVDKMSQLYKELGKDLSDFRDNRELNSDLKGFSTLKFMLDNYEDSVIVLIDTGAYELGLVRYLNQNNKTYANVSGLVFLHAATFWKFARTTNMPKWRVNWTKRADLGDMWMYTIKKDKMTKLDADAMKKDFPFKNAVSDFDKWLFGPGAFTTEAVKSGIY